MSTRTTRQQASQPQGANPIFRAGTTIVPVDVRVVDKQNRPVTDLKQSDLGVTVTSTWQPAADVKVVATYPYQISLLGMVVKSGSLSSTTTERVE